MGRSTTGSMSNPCCRCRAGSAAMSVAQTGTVGGGTQPSGVVVPQAPRMLPKSRPLTMPSPLMSCTDVPQAPSSAPRSSASITPSRLRSPSALSQASRTPFSLVSAAPAAISSQSSIPSPSQSSASARGARSAADAKTIAAAMKKRDSELGVVGMCLVGPSAHSPRQVRVNTTLRVLFRKGTRKSA